jgi:hypothetical protein
VHRRKNRYEALVTVAARDGVWKIVDLELRDEQRIDRSPQSGTEGRPEEKAAAPDPSPS